MKIGNTPSGIPEQAPPATAGGARATPDETAKAAPGGATGRSATVELSTAATGLLRPASGLPAEVDMAKVTRISQAIADGTFQVNAEAIADKLIANAQEVLGSVKR